MISFGFIITSLIVILIPGTGVIYTVSTGLMYTRKDSVAAALGCTAGIIPHLTASILGISAILHMSAMAFQIIKIFGIAYLLFLAWGIWRDKEAFKFEERSGKNNKLRIIIKGILINLLNPKLTLFFFAFLPQFISNDKGYQTIQMVILGALFMLLTFIIFVVYGTLANYFKLLVQNSPKLTRRIQQSFGVIFAALAVKLACTDQ